jgi:hypothetical protein
VRFGPIGLKFSGNAENDVSLRGNRVHPLLHVQGQVSGPGGQLLRGFWSN